MATWALDSGAAAGPNIVYVATAAVDLGAAATSNTGTAVGAAVGGLVLLVLCALLFVKTRAKPNEVIETPLPAAYENPSFQLEETYKEFTPHDAPEDADVHTGRPEGATRQGVTVNATYMEMPASNSDSDDEC